MALGNESKLALMATEFLRAAGDTCRKFPTLIALILEMIALRQQIPLRNCIGDRVNFVGDCGRGGHSIGASAGQSQRRRVTQPATPAGDDRRFNRELPERQLPPNSFLNRPLSLALDQVRIMCLVFQRVKGKITYGWSRMGWNERATCSLPGPTASYRIIIPGIFV